jgi:hypothetical protein
MLRRIIILSISLMTGLFAYGNISSSNISKMEVNITKIELKKADGSYYTMFEGSSVIDIASVSVDAVAGAVLEEKVVPDGTYTDVKVTVSNSFTVNACETLPSTNCTTAQVAGAGVLAGTINATVSGTAADVVIIPSGSSITSESSLSFTVENGICSLSNGFSVSFELDNVFGYTANGCNSGATDCIHFNAAPTINITAN